MELFGQNPDLIINTFSENFESLFLNVLRNSHGSSRVSACIVYQEMINDKDHIHMNSTRWTSLTEFLRYLGKEGRCKVEETPEGLFITYIGSKKDTFQGKRLKAEFSDEERHEGAICSQTERIQLLG